jgi:excisionase family DNA binding protein
MSNMNSSALFTVREAAQYLGVSVRTIKYHIYESGDLAPDLQVGKTLVFRRETLDRFKRSRRPAGRPRTR